MSFSLSIEFCFGKTGLSGKIMVNRQIGDTDSYLKKIYRMNDFSVGEY
jgi:hypothetical protein